MAGTPAQNGNSAAGNNDFSRRAEELAAAMWKTPRTVTGEYTRDQGDPDKPRLTLEGQAVKEFWATPDTPSGGRALPPGTTQTGQTPDGRKLTVGLENQAKIWSTPRGTDGEKGGPNQSFGAGGIPLASQTANWPTPAARDHKGANGADHLDNGTGRLHLDQLPNFVAHSFTHPDHPTRTHGVTFSQLLRIWRPLRASVIALHGRATWRRLWKGRHNKRLNPLFVEWLMGWPPGHALCACSEMEFAHWQQDMRSALYSLPTASAAWIWQPPAETETETLPTYEDVSLF